MRPIALTEQQPVALFARVDPRAQKAAQAGQASTIADQDHRHRRLGQVEATVAAQAQAKHAIHRQVLGQPTGSQAEVAIWVTLLAHDQLQYTVTGDRGDGVFTRADWHQRIDQRLCVQAHQLIAAAGQLATG
ncbi:hypothetical protein D3C81_1229740 [compost metagenome]